MFKKNVLSFLIIISIFTVGCKRNIFIDEKSNNSLNYDFNISDIENIDETLSKQKYYYSTDKDKRYIAVIIYKSNNASMKQYKVDNNEVIDLEIPRNSSFIISLYANKTVRYTWNIKNGLDKGVIQLENRSWIDTDMPESKKINVIYIGRNYARQNFYFKPIKSGKQTVVIRYEHETEKRDEFLELTFNIKIKK